VSRLKSCPSLSSVEIEVILWPKLFQELRCVIDSLIGPRVSNATGWNMYEYDPDNAAYGTWLVFWTPPSQLRRQLRMQKLKFIESANVVATVTTTTP